MELIIYLVDAFTDEKFSGNQAAVIPDGRDLSDESMQKIATELNVSETAFVKKIDDDNYDVRFFTPIQEVDLCGHATIATFYTLVAKGYINGIEDNKKRYFQHTKAGKLYVDVYISGNGLIEKVIMEQKKPQSIEKEININELANSMNIENHHISLNNNELKPEIITTGLPDIIVPIKNKSILESIQIDSKKVKEISSRLGAVGIHAFTISGGEIYSRNFAPLLGIEEEAATGTANGALFNYLRKNNLTRNNQVTINQGENLKRPSKIVCKISDEDPATIEVGGLATIILEGIIHI